MGLVVSVLLFVSGRSQSANATRISQRETRPAGNQLGWSGSERGASATSSPLHPPPPPPFPRLASWPTSKSCANQLPPREGERERAAKGKVTPNSAPNLNRWIRLARADRAQSCRVVAVGLPIASSTAGRLLNVAVAQQQTPLSLSAPWTPALCSLGRLVSARTGSSCCSRQPTKWLQSMPLKRESSCSSSDSSCVLQSRGFGLAETAM